MVFTTVYCRKKILTLCKVIIINTNRVSRYRPDWQAYLLLLVTCLLLTQTAVHARNIEYDATGLTIKLSQDVETAVNSGIELTFICEFAEVQQFLFFKWPMDIKHHRFRVKHHALSNSYLVSIDDELMPKIFSSFTQAMSFFADQTLTLFNNYRADNKNQQMRIALSKYDLPSPMRLKAFIANDWDINTGWETWQSGQ